ncbi:D-ribose pyranase [Pseudomonas sp. LTJR-52]|uniref:D-ribose pyranase n=1 Tax=Pseudomonas sp. LTJR-52 TaxID=2479392 RepID=UPI000EFB15A5|nr:D-ribose pyranase [Pseudomonas sp. LTJR-52]AYN93423.1 D-ribose pyranase [Pseudomonas sp. LTJR-52]
MKKTPLLNSALSRVIASLGHGDVIVIGDAGMPVPPGVECIDLAVTHGVPDFATTLRVIVSEMQVESHVLAEETIAQHPPALAEIQRLSAAGELGKRQLVSHEDLKVLCKKARVQVRTGECQPYTNIALIAGVTF